MLALLVLAPVFMAAAAVKLTSPDPMLFSQRPTCKHGREFSFHKLRTMGWNAEIERDALLDLNEVDGPVLQDQRGPPPYTGGPVHAARQHR
jgi:lipopolysaccharide/colanic/teichoic acid biosynthesis glycosyltransferase